MFGPLDLNTTPATDVLTETIPQAVRRYQQADFAWPHDHQGYHAGYAWLKLNRGRGHTHAASPGPVPGEASPGQR